GASGNILNLVDKAGHARSLADEHIDGHRRGECRVVEGIYATAAVQIAGKAAARIESNDVTGSAAGQVLHGGKLECAVQRAGINSGDVPGIGCIWSKKRIVPTVAVNGQRWNPDKVMDLEQIIQVAGFERNWCGRVQ